MSNVKFFLAVKGIVRKGGKILVLKRSESDDHKPGVWETPGGGMEHEESPQQALKREIKEETGLEVSVGRPFNIFTFTKDTGEFKVGITFLSEYVSGDVKLSHEHVVYQWIDPKKFRDLPSIPSLYNEIAQYAQES